MLLLVALVAILLSIVFFKYIQPTLKQYFQLRKEYEQITPLSIIPLLGNVHHFDKRPHYLFKLSCALSKQCQDQNKGLFCYWYSLWPMIILCTGQGLETFINNTKQSVKSFDYTLIEPWLQTGLLTSKGEKWRSRRRLITPSFHNTQLLHNFVEIFNKQARILVHRFAEFANQPEKTHNLHPFISACTLDIIAEAATGTHPNAQSNDGDNEIVKATIRMSEIISFRSRAPWLWPNFLFNLFPIGRDQAKALGILHNFSRKIIEERLATFDSKSNKTRLVFLDSLLTQMQQEKLTLDDIQEEVDTFMFEGHDTTAAAITFFCYLMGSYPDIQAKVHAELDSIFGDDRERECTIADIEEMKYFDCVIKESMRILPPVPAIAREVQEDFVYRDQTILKGTSVIIFIYGIHHDANVFPNPEKFDPDRFVNSSIVSDKQSPFAFIPFSAGSRNCIGQRFAGLEERVVLSTLLRHFRFRSTQTIDEIQLTSEAVLRTQVPIEMHVERR